MAAVNYIFATRWGCTSRFSSNRWAPGLDRILPEVLRHGPPEQLFRTVISGMLHKMYAADARGAWHLRIMAHEIARPDQGAPPRVAEEVIGPEITSYCGSHRANYRASAGPRTTRLRAASVHRAVVHFTRMRRPVIACLWPDFK